MLTQRQQELLDFLRREHRRTGIIPSTREIQQHFGFSSQTAAMSLLRALEAKGVIKRLPGKARAVSFVEPKGTKMLVMDIPLYGNIAAGLPQEAFAEPDSYLAMPSETLGLRQNAKAYALRVRGDSMIGASIAEGDYVILEQREPRDGDIVAALIDGETTLKRYLVRKGQPFLRAENPRFPDLIPVEELLVQGVMVALFRCVK